MKSLFEYLQNKPIDNKIIHECNIIFNSKNIDIDKWLFETYEEYLEHNKYISEDAFYKLKYDDDFINTPFYWYWQTKLYERLNNSLNNIDELFVSLIQNIKGIKKCICLNEFVIEIYYDEGIFDKNNKDFISFLNFSNYFIQSKEVNGKLPNPFKIEGSKPKEIEYNDKYAYHVTFKNNYDKIKKYGLCPKDKTYFVNHEPRIYLWIKPFDEFIIKAFGHLSLLIWYNEIQKNDKHNLYDKIDTNNLDNDLVLLKIDLEKFNLDHKSNLKLYGDPAYNKYRSAVFTLENIPTKYIQQVDFNELKNNN